MVFDYFCDHFATHSIKSISYSIERISNRIEIISRFIESVSHYIKSISPTHSFIVAFANIENIF